MRADPMDELEERHIRADERNQLAQMVEDNTDLFVEAGVDKLAVVRMIVLMIRLGGTQT